MATKLAQEWLKASLYDLISIEEIIHNDLLTHIVAFHSQQAIEKSLKALIENRNQRVPKIHSIRRLIELVDKNTYDLELIKLLDSLYIESRYPTNLGLLPYGKPTQEDAKEFFILAKTIFNDICNELNINKNELIK